MTAKREFISTNEVAQILGISPFTIRRYIQLRKLKAVKLEGSYRVRRADLDAFIQAREIETEEELAETTEPEPAESTPRRAANIVQNPAPRTKAVSEKIPEPRSTARAKRVIAKEPTPRAKRIVTPEPKPRTPIAKSKTRTPRGKEEKE